MVSVSSMASHKLNVRIPAESDYTIFVWRQQQQPSPLLSSSVSDSTHSTHSTPTLHLHNPAQSLPVPPAYLNASFYLFHPSRAHHLSAHSKSPSPSNRSRRSQKTKGTKHGDAAKPEEDGVPSFKKQFEKFHGENGVRTVMGSIGPVHNGKVHFPFWFISYIIPCSPHVTQIWLPTCLHLAQVCYSEWIHSQGRGARPLWLWRPRQHRDMAHNTHAIFLIQPASRWSFDIPEVRGRAEADDDRCLPLGGASF